MNNKKILILIPYQPPWQYYTHLFDIMKNNQDPFLDELIINQDLKIEKKDLDNVTAIALFYHDPLEALYPEVFQKTKKIYELSIELSIPFVNNPIALSNTTKSKQADIWKKNKIPCAKCWKVNSLEELNSQEIEYPVFLRYDSGHDTGGEFYSQPIQNKTELIKTYQEMKQNYTKKEHFSGMVAIQWIDTMDNQGYYRKYRSFVIGEKVFNGSLISSNNWFIHTHDRLNEDWARKEHLKFLAGKPLQEELMINATAALGLKINAIDYSFTKNGEPVLWESNPHPAWGSWIDESKEFQERLMLEFKNFFRGFLR